MGYHHCPIEPPDWSDGPDYAEGDCPDCDGTGLIDKDDDLDHTCPTCDGSGFLPRDYDQFDDDYM